MSDDRPSPPNGGAIADKRAEFEARTRKEKFDADADQAFIENKLLLVRTDPNLSDQQKMLAIAELKAKLQRKPP